MVGRNTQMKQMVTAVLSVLAMISLLLALPLRAEEESLEGVYMDDMRVIYPESSRNGVISTFSNNSSNNYLIQSMVRELDSKTGLPVAVNAPFLVIPPLAKVNAHSKQVLKILRTGGDFPRDRESAFFLNVRLLPSEKPLSVSTENGIGRVKIVMVLMIKMFYRPEGLPKEGVTGAVKQLRVSVKKDTVTLSNLSPFWITLQTLHVNAFAVPDKDLFKMVPPFGQQSWSLPMGNVSLGSKVTVSWRAINEFGLNTDEESKSIVVSGSE
ncbi:molecular chaperone [Photorhabdus khanii subsp. guanajuatensis]|uniref:Molecular chaperone n=2 Tax=Photorhabdus khanii TaxID=1004150 RepID=A0A4R4J6M3_9GAMM|nr:molecular chaperone [Photorhabdus khanii subsp. guanajuatensis]